MTEKIKPYGTVRIVTENEEEYQFARTVGGEITIDLSDPETPRVAADLDDREEPVVLTNGSHGTEVSESPPESTPVTDRDRETPTLLSISWMFWLGILPGVTLLYGAIAAAVWGPGIWSPAQSMFGPLAVRAAWVWTMLVSSIGTAWIWKDAGQLAAAGASWQPRPGLYTGAGAVIVAAIGAAWYLSQGMAVTEVLLPAAGLLIIGTLVGSAFTGPVYVFNRHRHVGLYGIPEGGEI